MQEHRDVHVVADGVNPVRRAYAAAVAVARIDEHGQVWPGHLDAFGHRQRTTVNTVKAVGFHVVRKAAGAANAGDKYGLLRCQRFIPAQTLYGSKNGVVAATVHQRGTPL